MRILGRKENKMGRPSKAVTTMTGVITKEEEERRRKNEEALKGGKDKVNKAPAWFSKEQKKIRKELVKELEKILTNIDCYILDQAVISISRLREIEMKINENPDELTQKTLISAKKQYANEFFRCCSELSMSPQSRAKLANSLPVVKEKKNPLSVLLEDDNE